jgi:hypothetical protein
MRKLLPLFLSIVAFLTVGAAASAGSTSPPPDEPKKAGSVIQTQDTNVAGVVAELIECKAKEGVLSIKVRLRNSGNEKAKVQIISGRDFEKYYVTAGSKKYFVLRDSEGVPLAPAADGFGGLGVQIEKGGSWMWWAKYPAPPDSETKVNYITPFGAPFEDVPISR